MALIEAKEDLTNNTLGEKMATDQTEEKDLQPSLKTKDPQRKGHREAKLKLKFSKFGVALKMPFRKSFENLGISKIVRETIKEFETNSRNLDSGNSKFFKDLTVFILYKNAQIIGDVLMSMKH